MYNKALTVFFRSKVPQTLCPGGLSHWRSDAPYPVDGFWLRRAQVDAGVSQTQSASCVVGFEQLGCTLSDARINSTMAQSRFNVTTPANDFPLEVLRQGIAYCFRTEPVDGKFRLLFDDVLRDVDDAQRYCARLDSKRA